MHMQLKQLTCNCVVSDCFMQWSIRITVYVGINSNELLEHQCHGNHYWSSGSFYVSCEYCSCYYSNCSCLVIVGVSSSVANQNKEYYLDKLINS